MENRITKLHRRMNYFHNLKLFWISRIIRQYTRVVYSCDIGPTCKIGRNVSFGHNGLGVVIHPEAEIGNGTKIMQNVTIGGNGSVSCPKIGNNVLVGAGACVLGDIVVGDNVKIGANAVVLHDVPSNSVVVGIPAKVIKHI